MRKRAFEVATLALAIAALALPASGAGADWPTYGHDLTNSRDAGGDGPSQSQVGSMKQAWSFSSPTGDFTGTPVVSDGVLVAGNNGGWVYALNAVTGKLLWSKHVGQPINGSAAIDPNAPGGATTYIPVAEAGRPHLLALSLSNGATRWDTVLTQQPGADVFGSPTFWNGTLYMGTSGNNNDESSARGSLVALDQADGRVRWQTFTVPPGHDGGAVWSTPAVDTATGRLYIGTGNAYHAPAADTTDAMLVLDASTGQILGHFQSVPGDVWELDSPTGGPDYDFGASPNLIAGPGGRPLVGEGSKSGTYWALDRATMKPAWSLDAGPGSQADGGINSSAYDGTRIYGTDAISSQVFALGRDGKMLWNSADAGPAHFSPVALGHGVVYSVDPAGFLTARDPASGKVLAKLPLNGPDFGGVSLVGGAVYVSVGIGPPPQPLPQTDTSGFDGSGSIVAFGDTSRSGGATAGGRAPASSLTGHGGSPPARGRAGRIRLSVTPRRAAAKRPVVFRFRARSGAGALSGVTIGFAGRHVRTDRRGRAVMRLRLSRPGLHLAHARRRGMAGARAAVTVTRRR
ncbi:MAG: PQQ-binding-like beta-propeller repeat protein [Thermoleophilaceae bacterium]